MKKLLQAVCFFNAVCCLAQGDSFSLKSETTGRVYGPFVTRPGMQVVLGQSTFTMIAVTNRSEDSNAPAKLSSVAPVRPEWSFQVEDLRKTGRSTSTGSPFPGQLQMTITAKADWAMYEARVRAKVVRNLPANGTLQHFYTSWIAILPPELGKDWYMPADVAGFRPEGLGAGAGVVSVLSQDDGDFKGTLIFAAPANAQVFHFWFLDYQPVIVKLGQKTRQTPSK